MTILFKVRANEQFNSSIVRSCGYQALSARPVNAINAAYVVVLLLQDHVHLLYLTLRLVVVDSSARICRVILLIIRALSVELGQGADFESLGVCTEHEVLPTGAETARSYRLVISQLRDLSHMAHR